jgi:hypothetical protein
MYQHRKTRINVKNTVPLVPKLILFVVKGIIAKGANERVF